MSIVKYNPFRSMRPAGIDNLFDDFFGRSLSDFIGGEFTSGTPSVNVIENEDSYVIDVAAPGLMKDDFKVEVDNDSLIISAEKKSEKEEEKGKYTRQEFNYTSFKRSFHLSEDINAESINAVYADGILKITVGKKETAITKAPQTIAIK